MFSTISTIVSNINSTKNTKKLLGNSFLDLGKTTGGGGFYTASMNHQITGGICTVEFWAKHPKPNQVGGTNIESIVNFNEAPYIHLTGGKITSNPTVSSTVFTGSGITEWYHIAAVYNNTNLTYYVNGILDSSHTVTQQTFANNIQIVFGNRSSATQNLPYDGYLSQIRIWNVARTQTQIQQNYKTVLIPPFSSNLIHYVQLDGNAIDGIGNVNLTAVLGTTLNWNTDVPF